MMERCGWDGCDEPAFMRFKDSVSFGGWYCEAHGRELMDSNSARSIRQSQLVREIARLVRG